MPSPEGVRGENKIINTMKKVFLLVCWVSLTLICFVSCESSDAELRKKLAYMDITDATSLFIAPRNNDAHKIVAKNHNATETTRCLFQNYRRGCYSRSNFNR